MEKLKRLDSSLKLLVFQNDWCAQCYTERPIVESIADRYSGQLEVQQVNAQEHPELVQRYHIQSAPSLVLIKNQQVVEQIPRFMDQAQLQSLINYYV